MGEALMIDGQVVKGKEECHSGIAC